MWLEYLICRGDQMAEQNSLVEKEEKTIDIEHKDSLLDELNLPPKVTEFIRNNSRNLQILAGCVVVLVFAWTYYDYYSQNKADNASSALNSARQEVDITKRGELLKNVENEFAGTGAALWSRIELAHIDFKSENYGDALTLYLDIVSELDDDSHLLPLLNYNIGLAYENSGDHDNALGYYAKLAGYKGFKVKGLMAQGRLYELKNENSEALRVYQEASDNDKLTVQDKSILIEKINTLQAPGTAKVAG
jgi:predicted negative regulator of RcsB-dependent stress response